MAKIEANVPDYLAKQAFAVAERNKVPVDEIVALALSAQIAAWKGSDDMASRAKRADIAKFDRVSIAFSKSKALRTASSKSCAVSNTPIVLTSATAP